MIGTVYITKKEMCQMLKVSRTHLDRLLIKKDIKSVPNNYFQRKLLFSRSEFEEKFGLRTMPEQVNEEGMKNDVSFVEEVKDLLDKEDDEV